MIRTQLPFAVATVVALLIYAVPAQEADSQGQSPLDALDQFVEAFPGSGRFVLLRSYLPTNGRNAVNMPTITVVANGQRTQLPECPWRSTSLRDHRQAEDAISSDDFDIRRFLRTIVRIIRLESRVAAPFCSWWFVVDNQTFNIAFPDSHATYWATPFLAEEGTELEIEGEYGDMRYMSLGIYDQKFNYYEWSPVANGCDNASGQPCFGSYVTDYQIDPIVPFTNPFQDETGYPSARYKVTITTTPQSTLGNVLPALSSQSGCLPGQSCNLPDGDPPLGSGLGTVQGIFPAPCSFAGSPFTCASQGMFSSPPTAIQSGVVSNPDNAYIPTWVDARDQQVPLDFQEPDKVFVVRGRLPKTPPGTSPVPWPNTNFDMRYWSICSAVYFVPYPTVESDDACLADLDVRRTDEQGRPREDGEWFTVIVSTPEARPDIDYEAVGANWLEATSLSRTILIVRNMVTSEDFAHAGQNVPRDGSWISAFQAMQDYYPAVTTWCNKAHLEENGWGGCVAPKIEDTGGSSDETADPGVSF